MRSARTINLLLLRIAALVAHAVLNVIILNYLTDFDITGSWLMVFGFIVIVLLLLYLFIRHTISFIHFIKHK